MVSIIIPIYNGERFVEKTIRSCLGQTYNSIEIIAVDDGSSDKSIEIIRKIAEEDSRVILIENNRNNGFCRNCNLGIKASTGEYILVLGQDDVLEECHIERMLQCFRKEIVAVYCDYCLIDEKDNVIGYVETKCREEVFPKDFIYQNAVPSCGLVMRASAVKKVKGYPEFKSVPQYGEWYLWLKLLRCGKIVFCETVKSKYRRHSDNITNTFAIEDYYLQYCLEAYWNRCRLYMLFTGMIDIAHLKPLAKEIITKQKRIMKFAVQAFRQRRSKRHDTNK